MDIGLKAVAAGLAAAAALAAAPASAQATRTWVSGVGDDVNPCSRTAPCKTFAGAISKTAAKGEINCLDSGGFGAVTITKSITILCEGVVAGVLAAGSTGITVNAAETDNVTLSGLDIHGGGSGVIGVRVLKAKSVIIRDAVIQSFTTKAISVEGPARVTVEGTAILHNVLGISGAVVNGGGNLLAGNDADGSFATASRPK